MAKNFLQEGSTLDLKVAAETDAVDIASGKGYLVGSIFGVAVADVAVGESGSFQVDGCWSLDKTTGETWSVGQALFWDPSTSKVTTTAGSLKKIGVAIAAASSPATTGSVRLNGSF
jgi:predicted RecA/RadA family phage recombinase